MQSLRDSPSFNQSFEYFLRARWLVEPILFEKWADLSFSDFSKPVPGVGQIHLADRSDIAVPDFELSTKRISNFLVQGQHTGLDVVDQIFSYSLSDDALSLDAGNVSIANLTLRPAIIWALDADTVSDSNSQLSFAPRFVCERIRAVSTNQSCGAGAEFSFSSRAEDGMSNAEFRVLMDQVGGNTHSSIALNFEHRF